MTKTQEQHILNIVCKGLTTAGYDPFTQLTGYMATGNPAYITRKYGTRELAVTLSPAVIQVYLAKHSQARTA